MVFRSHDGLDELTTTGPSSVVRTGDGEPVGFELDPGELGLARADADALAGGDVERNAAIAEAILGGERGPGRDVVLLNAAAALVVSGRSSDLREGIEEAARSIDSGAAARVLETWVDVSQRAAKSG